ncbi:Aldehyde dehydrogenase, thermostable [compost metagenome]
MGGKNPVIVLNDADLELAVEATISGGLRSTGQKCTATSRVIVQSEVYEAFRERLLRRIQDIQVGPGMDSSTWMGPCASEKQYDTVLSYIAKGKEEGGTLLCGGGIAQGQGLEEGYFIEPTVFEHVASSMTLAQGEIFGPVLALIKVDSFEEAIHIANDVKFGLSASIFTKDFSRMLTFLQDIDAGLVRINAESAGVELQAPFGGLKMSSSGSREQGQAAIEFYTDIKTVFMKA